jgi:hypothetical protein
METMEGSQALTGTSIVLPQTELKRIEVMFDFYFVSVRLRKLN